MSTYYDKAKGCYRFTFNRIIHGKQVRASRLLPKAWTAAQADAFGVKESARIYAEATGITEKVWTIDEAIEKFIDYKLEGLKSKDDYLREFKQLYYLYVGKSITELPDVCNEINKLTKTSKKSGSQPELLSAATRRNKIRYLCAACNYAFKHHGFGNHLPSERVNIPKVKNARQNTPDRKDMLSLARKMRMGDARAALICAFYSGMRQGEILRAVVKGGAFVLSDTKNGRPRHVPIHPKLKMYLKYFPIGTAGHVIFGKFRKARKILALDHYTFHDFRHGAASAMINSGVSLNTVGSVLGHKSQVSTQRYAHLDLSTLRNAVNLIGKK